MLKKTLILAERQGFDGPPLDVVFSVIPGPRPIPVPKCWIPENRRSIGAIVRRVFGLTERIHESSRTVSARVPRKLRLQSVIPRTSPWRLQADGCVIEVRICCGSILRI